MPDIQSRDTDELIASEVQRGRTDLFNILVTRYEQRLLRYGHTFLRSHEDIEDITQNIFIKVYINIKSFKISERFSPWIYRIAHNEFVNAARKRRDIPLFSFDLDTMFPQLKEKSITEELDRDILKAALTKYLAMIDLKYREPLVLFYFDDLPYTDIADVLHLPISTVGVRISRGKQQLKKIISEQHTTPLI
jgi:RNA polymerase sigma-70 factor, ECF subfamily